MIAPSNLELAYKVTRAFDRFSNRIQGFRYSTSIGDYHVIRDVWAPWGEQEIYRKHISEATDQEFYEACVAYRMAYALEEAMKDGKEEKTNPDSETQAEPQHNS